MVVVVIGTLATFAALSVDTALQRDDVTAVAERSAQTLTRRCEQTLLTGQQVAFVVTETAWLELPDTTVRNLEMLAPEVLLEKPETIRWQLSIDGIPVDLPATADPDTAPQLVCLRDGRLAPGFRLQLTTDDGDEVIIANSVMGNIEVADV